ncbi:MAG: radical SAM protein [Candidatus Schekmanbacteria bacterium]|nr:radical SAM protein [Candidatus Schekmanbacteria bacterium]
MRVSFVIPPSLLGDRDVERVFGCTYGLYPIPNIYMLYAAAVARQQDHAVRFLDAPVLGLSAQEFATRLGDDDSDAYVFYTVNLAEKNDLAAHALVRRRRSSVPIVFAGPAPTHHAAAFLVDDNTFVVRGEPELPLAGLLKALEGGAPGNLAEIAGLSYRRGEDAAAVPSAVPVKSLDELPFPARDLLEVDRYYNPKIPYRPFTAMLTSRGCSYPCRYCVPNSLSFARELEFKSTKGKKPPVRVRSAENVIAELQWLKEHGYRAISMLDDIFIWGLKRHQEICEALGSLEFKWGCLSRADHLSEDAVVALKEARCQYVDVGVESFNQAVLDDVHKEVAVEETMDALERCRRHGVPVKLNILIGSSALETAEDVRRNIEIARQLAPKTVMFGIANPFPGTEWWDEAKEKGYLLNPEYRPVDVQKSSSIRLPNLDEKKLQELVREANRRWFLRPAFVAANIGLLARPAELKRALQSLWKKMS